MFYNAWRREERVTTMLRAHLNDLIHTTYNDQSERATRVREALAEIDRIQKDRSTDV